MFTVHLVDTSHDYVIHDPHSNNACLLDATVSTEVSKAGTFVFKMLSNHPYYDDIEIGKCLIEVYRDDEVIFAGMPTYLSIDFNLTKSIECEGIFAQFNDTVQRFCKYDNQSAGTVLQAIVDIHNSYQPNISKIYLANATIPYALSSKPISIVTNMTTTMETIQQILNLCGGYMVVVKQSSSYYLMWKNAELNTSDQKVVLGKNIININITSDLLEVANKIVPLGAIIQKSSSSSSASRPRDDTSTDTSTDTTTETTDTTETEEEEEPTNERLTIKTVNNNRDYLTSTYYSPVTNITRTIIYDDIKDATVLLNAGIDYLSRMVVENQYIEVKAFDLSYTTDDEPLSLLDKVNVISVPHDINDWFLVTKMEVNINDPSSNVITFGINKAKTISELVK